MTQVMMVDVHKFTAAVDDKVKEYMDAGDKERNANHNEMAIFNFAVGHAIHDLAKIIVESSKMEKWD